MFTVRLERIRELSASTKDFRFVREDGAPLDCKPGQFYRFIFTDVDGAFERSYSLCNFDGLGTDRLDLVVSEVKDGRATRLLFDSEPGLTAEVTGPFGRLLLPEPLPKRLVLVATSVGIAPYLPMLKALAESLDAGSKVVLLFGVRDRSEFLYRDILLDYAKRYPGFDLRLCLSRENSMIEPYEYKGYVTNQLESLAPNP
ncbi:MAG: ferredoxin--NADP reductase, partial [Pseudomonadales bacterium]